LASISVENVETNRRALRELLFTTPGAFDCLSGVILFEETLYQKTASGIVHSFVISNDALLVSVTNMLLHLY